MRDGKKHRGSKGKYASNVKANASHARRSEDRDFHIAEGILYKGADLNHNYLTRSALYGIIRLTLMTLERGENIMSKSKHPDSKVQALRDQKTLNSHPECVHDELFIENEFFDARDLLQVKYEMLRRVRVENQPLARAARAFGFSRPSFYKAQAEFEENGLLGLIPRRRGPKQAHKLDPELMQFIQQALEGDESLGAPQLADMVAGRFGVRVHPRSIQRALARYQKKRA